jgi:hypothetical protein
MAQRNLWRQSANFGSTNGDYVICGPHTGSYLFVIAVWHSNGVCALWDSSSSTEPHLPTGWQPSWHQWDALARSFGGPQDPVCIPWQSPWQLPLHPALWSAETSEQGQLQSCIWIEPLLFQARWAIQCPVCLNKVGLFFYNYTHCFVWMWNLVSYFEEGHTLSVSENGVLRRIFGPEWEEVVGVRRRLHEVHHNLYWSQNVIRGIKSRRMRCAGYVAHMGRWEMCTKF